MHVLAIVPPTFYYYYCNRLPHQFLTWYLVGVNLGFLFRKRWKSLTTDRVTSYKHYFLQLHADLFSRHASPLEGYVLSLIHI